MKFATKQNIIILAVIILIQTLLAERHRKKQFPVQRPRVKIFINLN